MYHISGKFRRVKLSQIPRFCNFRERNFLESLYAVKNRVSMLYRTELTFMNNLSFANAVKFGKFAKLYPLKTFPLYSIHFVQGSVHCTSLSLYLPRKLVSMMSRTMAVGMLV